MEHEAEGEILQEELEMVIPNIQLPADEKAVAVLLRKLRGVDAVAVGFQHVWLAFRPSLIRRQKICEMLKANRFPPSETLEDGCWVKC